MYISPIEKLRFIYNGLLMGMPSFAYNPINKNNLLAPMCVQQYSTYINFKLDSKQVTFINDYINEYTNGVTKHGKTGRLFHSSRSEYFLRCFGFSLVFRAERGRTIYRSLGTLDLVLWDLL